MDGLFMISILLATYNGARFLEKQLDSLFQQTVQDFVVYASDDGSRDGTIAILEDYTRRFPQRIFISQNRPQSGGTKHNFYQMMTRHKNDYVMLCDQDDVWKPDKIEHTLNEMTTMEARYGLDTPILVHTDLCVTDEHLQIISPSFKAAMNADYKKTALHQQVIQNTLTGCTAMYNRALADLLTEEPSYMVMHDWFLMLVASAFGRISSLEEPTILYRQHKGNVVGAKDVRTLKYKLHKLLGYRGVKRALTETYRQAESFLSLYRDSLSVEHRQLLLEYCAIPSKSKFGKWCALYRLKTMKNGFSRKVAHFMFV